MSRRRFPFGHREEAIEAAHDPEPAEPDTDLDLTAEPAPADEGLGEATAAMLARSLVPPRITDGSVAWIGRPLVFAGDAPVMRLYRPDDDGPVAAAAYLRATYSEHGAGRVLYAWLAHGAGGPWSGSAAFTDNHKLPRFLAQRIVAHLPEFAGLGLEDAPVESATFERVDDLEVGYRVVATVGEHRVVAEWRDPRDRRVIHVRGFRMGSEQMDLTTLMVPCGRASLTIDGWRADGVVRAAAGDDRSQSSAYVAVGTAWTAPEPIAPPIRPRR
jgi:hypothetical protein